MNNLYNNLKASIIIRTYNEEKYLDKTLSMIYLQTLKSFEVIIIDSGSVDNTLNIAKKYPVIIKKIPKNLFTYGFSLNVGAELSSGNILVILSAHSVPLDEKWLENLLKPFSDSSIAGVCGKQIPHPHAQFTERMRIKTTFDKKNHFIDLGNLFFSNSNSALRKKNWKINKFDELIEYGEDVIWAKNQIEKGFKIYYESSAVVLHSHNYTWRALNNKYTNDYLSFLRNNKKRQYSRLEKFPFLVFIIINSIMAMKKSFLYFIEIRRFNLLDFYDYCRSHFIYKSVRYKINRKIKINSNFFNQKRSNFTYTR